MAARSESRLKTELVQVRATPEEKERLRARAAAFGISMGELCRQSIFKATPRSKTDQGAIAELASSRADLGRLGGLLKGWLSGAFDRSAPDIKSRDDVIALLRQIETGQTRVLAAVKKVAG